VDPAVFERFADTAHELGFAHAACGPLVRSSYHADQQAHEAGVE
jgi:lipoic acid synthetase